MKTFEISLFTKGSFKSFYVAKQNLSGISYLFHSKLVHLDFSDTNHLKMKYIIYSFIALASILLIYNLTVLDFENLFEGESSTALVGVFASLCVIVLMLILLISRIIKDKSEEN